MSYREDIARLDSISRSRALKPYETDALYHAIRLERREQIRAQAAPPPPGRKR